MHFVSAHEAESMLGPLGFTVTRNAKYGRMALTLDVKHRQSEFRIGAHPKVLVASIVPFAMALIRWLPDNERRLLWIDHAEDDYPNTLEAFMAARIGIGEARSLLDAPGICFDPFPYNEEDQQAITPAQERQVGIMSGLLILTLVNAWDGWLLSDNSRSRIEFWEGNIFFYSTLQYEIDEAREILDAFGCTDTLI